MGNDKQQHIFYDNKKNSMSLHGVNGLGGEGMVLWLSLSLIYLIVVFMSIISLVTH
jgi:hypothetical protein